jgi:phosphoglycolate phosphatase
LGEVRAVLFDKDGTLSISEPELITLAKARVFLCVERVPQPLRVELRSLLLRAYGLHESEDDTGASRICPAGITAGASRDHNLIATATALVQVGLGWPEALSLSEQVFAEADQADARRPLVRPSTSAEARPSPGSGGEATHLDSGGRPTGGTSITTEGLIPWLEQLRAASVACAVISNDDVAGIEHFLASHGLTPYFAAIWSAEHRPRKPDPAAVHGLCEQLGISASDCALIGDANSDLRMAVAAGIPHQRALGYTATWSTPPGGTRTSLPLTRRARMVFVTGTQSAASSVDAQPGAGGGDGGPHVAGGSEGRGSSRRVCVCVRACVRACVAGSVCP